MVCPSPTLAGANACLVAALDAAGKYQVPAPLLVTIARAESGKGPDQVPWPWTVNSSGRGYHFTSRAEALEAVRKWREQGEANLDIGCFQLNFRWHGHAFASTEDMMDPARNADHAARFLRDLHREKGNWKAASGAYHSRTENLGKAYVARLEQIFTGRMRNTSEAEERGAIGALSGTSPARNLLEARPPLAVHPVRPLPGTGA